MIDVPDDIQEAVVKKFRDNYPEYYGSENNAAKMRQVVESLVDAGHSYSSDVLALAWNHLNAAGQLEQAEVERAEVSPVEMTYANHIDSLARNEHRMTDGELEKSLLSAGIWVPKRSGSMWR